MVLLKTWPFYFIWVYCFLNIILLCSYLPLPWIISVNFFITYYISWTTWCFLHATKLVFVLNTNSVLLIRLYWAALNSRWTLAIGTWPVRTLPWRSSWTEFLYWLYMLWACTRWNTMRATIMFTWVSSRCIIWNHYWILRVFFFDLYFLWLFCMVTTMHMVVLIWKIKTIADVFFHMLFLSALPLLLDQIITFFPWL